MATRYSIYIYARQTGCWPELLGTSEDIARYSLSEEDFALLPPGFFTASSGDQDVPFRESKQMPGKTPAVSFSLFIIWNMILTGTRQNQKECRLTGRHWHG